MPDAGSRLKCVHRPVVTLLVIILGDEGLHAAPTLGQHTGLSESGHRGPSGGNVAVPTDHHHHRYYIKTHIRRVLKSQARISSPTDRVPDGSLVQAPDRHLT